ncbi:hypothetical protein, partial [Roseomonas mucosa]|uniref:hypothetical protein n=1 Tax=Roseomonas mucosa TaxID=207340 RepID=UPI001B80AAEF
MTYLPNFSGAQPIMLLVNVAQVNKRRGTTRLARRHPSGADILRGHCHVVWGPSKFDREAEFA